MRLSFHEILVRCFPKEQIVLYLVNIFTLVFNAFLLLFTWAILWKSNLCSLMISQNLQCIFFGWLEYGCFGYTHCETGFMLEFLPCCTCTGLWMCGCYHYHLSEFLPCCTCTDLWMWGCYHYHMSPCSFYVASTWNSRSEISVTRLTEWVTWLLPLVTVLHILHSKCVPKTFHILHTLFLCTSSPLTLNNRTMPLNF